MITKAVLLLLLLTYPSLAGLFIGPMTPEHRFVLNGGETALLNMLPAGVRSFDLYLGDKKFTGNIEASDFVTKAALVGPAELVITNLGVGTSPVSFNYRIITNSNILGTVIDAATNVTIDVPANRTIHLIGIMGFVEMTLKQGDWVGYIRKFPSDMEIDGPVTISVATSFFAAYIAYFIKDSVTVMPEGAILKIPAGNFEVQLQKSTDLTSWTPSAIIPTAADGRAFYRLKVE